VQRRSTSHRLVFHRRAAWLLVPIMLAALTGCAGDGADGPKPEADHLRIGVTPNYPPVVFRDVDGKLSGIEIELAKQAAANLNRRPDFVELAWDELIPNLEAGKIDVIMSGMSVTLERSERVLFTTPWMAVGQLALIRREDLARYASPSAIHRQGARVGFVRETTGQMFVRDELRRAQAFGFETVADGVRSLRAQRIDFFVHDAPTIWRIALTPGEEDLMGLYQFLTEESLAWAVARDNRALERQLNSVLDGLRARNQIEPLLNRFIPVRVKVGR
jgi:ABC-type amino acid transport substrate-binding protein